MIGLLGIGIAIGGLFLPWPGASVLCGALGAVCLIRAFMDGMSG